MSTPTNAAERLMDCLKQGKKLRGFKSPRYDRKSGNIVGYSIQHVEVIAGDVVEVAKKISRPDQKCIDLEAGSAGDPARHVVLQADDLFHLLEKAGTKIPDEMTVEGAKKLTEKTEPAPAPTPAKG